jgi:micrococcal nuclease
VRLYGVDAPESKQAFGSRAKQFTSGLALGKTVTVRIRDVDRYERAVGEVILPDGRNLNQEIVKAGFAWWYRRYAKNDATLKRLEEEARLSRRGLWVDKEPVPPWEFRRARTAESATR